MKEQIEGKGGDMLYYINPCTDAAFNLALEEYLMKSYPSDEDIFSLWQGRLAVLIGRFQNTTAQINSDFVKQNDVTIVRRITGGGAVYQDLGNLNYSWIIRNRIDMQYNFNKLAEPVISALLDLGVKAEFNGRNDITVDNRKISGNAQHIYKGTVLHHGTLLLNSELDVMEKVLKVKEDKLRNKGVVSISSRVANLTEFLQQPISMTDFKQKILHSILINSPNSHPLNLTQNDMLQIEILANSKYRTWEWNYGKSPDYNNACSKRLCCGEVEFYLKINKEMIIESIRIFGDFLGGEDIAPIERGLTGAEFARFPVGEILKTFDVSHYFAGASADDILELIFSNSIGGFTDDTAQA